MYMYVYASANVGYFSDGRMKWRVKLLAGRDRRARVVYTSIRDFLVLQRCCCYAAYFRISCTRTGECSRLNEIRVEVVGKNSKLLMRKLGGFSVWLLKSK